MALRRSRPLAALVLTLLAAGCAGQRPERCDPAVGGLSHALACGPEGFAAETRRLEETLAAERARGRELDAQGAALGQQVAARERQVAVLTWEVVELERQAALRRDLKDLARRWRAIQRRLPGAEPEPEPPADADLEDTDLEEDGDDMSLFDFLLELAMTGQGLGLLDLAVGLPLTSPHESLRLSKYLRAIGRAADLMGSVTLPMPAARR